MIPADSYWSALRAKRLGRRRLLGGVAAGLGALGLGLAGCGSGSKRPAGDLLDHPEDTTSRASGGGVLPSYFPTDTASFDGIASAAAQAAMHNDYTYARLVNLKTFNVTKGELLDSSVEAYAAQSWEVSADGLQYTFRLQPNGGLDPRPPTSGRVLDAQDVVFAWNKFKASSKSNALLSNDVNRSAPVVSMAAPDPRTVVMRLAFPSSSILTALGYHAFLPLIPKDADKGFDASKEMRGSGPWMLAEYKAGASFSYRRNPGFYRNDRPLMMGADAPILSEYALGLAALKQGKVFSYPVRQEDIVQTKLEQSSLRLLTDDSFPLNPGATAFFGFKPNSVFRDDRVRQALSRLIDRDRYIDAMYNVASFAKQGLSAPRRWSTLLPTGEESFWLDPQSTEFGDAAKYLRYDPTEAKKLLQAVGKGTIEAPLTSIATGEYGGAAYLRDVQFLKTAWEAGGDFRLKANVVDYASVFLPKYSLGGPGRDMEGSGGIALASIGGLPDPDLLLGAWYVPGGPFYKLEPDFPNDPKWDALVKSERTEMDRTKRVAVLKDIQRYQAEKLHTIPRPGAARGYYLMQPWLMNAGAFISREVTDGSFLTAASTNWQQWWLDTAKMK